MTDISNLPKPVKLAFIKHEPSTSTNKPPVLIYHGIFSNKEAWTSLGKEISEKTQRVVYCLDVRNHGDSTFTPEFNFEDMISDAVNFLNENNISVATMLGHSLGGMIFSRLSTLFPNLVEKLIIVDIHPQKRLSKDKGLNMVQLFARMLKKVIEKIREEKMDMEKARARLDELLKSQIKDEGSRKGYLNKLTIRDGQIDWRFNLDVLTNFLDSNHGKPLGLEDITPNFSGPTLEVYGSLSAFVNEEDFESILKMLPNTKFEVIEGADHILPATHPKEFIEKVVPFINA